MALGQLVVRLGLDAAEFVTGMSRAEARAKNFRSNLEKSLGSLKATAIGLGAIGAAAGAAFAAMDRLVKNAADFKDMEERVGASAESLASLAVAAGTAGTAMSEIEAASIKLTKGISGLDEESKAAASALKALGIPIKEFKALDPVSQMEAVAKALGGFADGAGKTAIALALFGKAGAQMLPFLKELGQEGARQVILTQKQIDLADEYADRQARLTTQIKLYAQSIAVQALPAVNDLTEAFKKTIQQLFSTSSAAEDLKNNSSVEAWADSAARAIAFVVDSGDGAIRVFQGIALTIRAGISQTSAFGKAQFSDALEIGRQWQKDMAALAERPLFSQNLEQARAQRIRDSGFGMGDRGAGFKRPSLDFSGFGLEAKKGVDAAKRELESLREFIDKLNQQGLGDAIGLDDKTIADLEKLDEAVRRLNLSQSERNRLIDVILDNDTKLRQEQEKKTKAAEDLLEIQKKALDASADMVSGLLAESGAIGLSAEALARYNVQLKVNDALKDSDLTAETRNAIIANGEAAKQLAVNNVQREKAYDAAKRGVEAGKDLVRAYTEEAGAIGKTGIELELYRINLDKVRALTDVTDLSQRAYIESLFATAQALAAANDAQRRFNDDAVSLNDSFRSSFADNFSAVLDGTKSFKDAMKDMVKSWTKALNDMAAKKLSEALFGKEGNAGGGLLPDFGKMFSGLFNTGSISGPGKYGVSQPPEPTTNAAASFDAAAASVQTFSARLGGAITGVELPLVSLAGESGTAATGITSMLAAVSTSSAGLATLTAAESTAAATLTSTVAPLTLLATNAGLAASALAAVAASSTAKGGADIFKGLFSGSDADPFGIGGWAFGGPTPINDPIWVGERGAELFVPQTAGRIIPNNDVRKIGNRTTHISIVNHVPANMSRASAAQLSTSMGLQVQRAMARDT